MDIFETLDYLISNILSDVMSYPNAILPVISGIKLCNQLLREWKLSKQSPDLETFIALENKLQILQEKYQHAEEKKHQPTKRRKKRRKR
jgi:hypothetical protein